MSPAGMGCCLSNTMERLCLDKHLVVAVICGFSAAIFLAASFWVAFCIGVACGVVSWGVEGLEKG